MTKNKSFAVFLASVLMLGSTVGCGTEESSVKPASTGNFIAEGEVHNAPSENTAETEAPADENDEYVFVETKDGSVGEADGFDGVTMNINRAYRSDLHFTQGGQNTTVVFFDVTVDNQSDTKMSANMLTSYYFEVDGQEYQSSTLHAIGAVSTVFGEDANQFTSSIMPGDKQQGYVGAEVPENFETITVYCMPLGGRFMAYDSSKAIVYHFNADDFEPIA